MVVIKQRIWKTKKSGKSDFSFIFDDDFGFFLLCNLSKRNTPLAIRPHLKPYLSTVLRPMESIPPGGDTCAGIFTQSMGLGTE
jgi:hypothetical protein